MSVQWDQSRFDEGLKKFLMEHESAVWPRLLNKKAFWIAYNAMTFTGKTRKEIIIEQLTREIKPKRQDGTTSKKDVPIGFVIAAKRASKHWGGVKALKTGQALEKKRGFSEGNLWRQLLVNRFKSMLGGRTRSVGFIRVGWLAAIKQVAPHAGESYSRARSGADSPMRGAMKGSTDVATPAKLQVVIENTAESKTAPVGGFGHEGSSGLTMAMERESAIMNGDIELAMKPGIEKFNREQK